MKNFTLDQLRTFVDVIELASFSAAAERAGISQPAVSLQIRQLERQLEVRLIERVGRRAQATPAGQNLLLHARRIQEEVASAIEAITPHRTGKLGRVRIGTGATACIYLLPRILQGLKERMPGLEITVQTGNTHDILKLLEANALDIAVVTMPAPGRMFQVTKICDDELVAVSSNNEPGSKKAVNAAFLTGRPLLLYEGGNTRRLIDQWFSRSGHAPKPMMELGSVEAIKQLIGAGLGWAILPSLAIDIAQQNISVRPLSPRLTRSLGIVLRRDKQLTRPLQEVIGALQGKRGKP